LIDFCFEKEALSPGWVKRYLHDHSEKIDKGDYWELKVRLTKNGKPFWTMSPEELRKERAQQKPQN
jgi:hypothetical protein